LSAPGSGITPVGDLNHGISAKAEGSHPVASDASDVRFLSNPTYRYSSASDYDNDASWRSLMEGARKLGARDFSPLPPLAPGSTVGLKSPSTVDYAQGSRHGDSAAVAVNSVGAYETSTIRTEHRWAGDYTSPGATPPPAPSPQWLYD
jgi:hypothetical protein